MNSTPHRRDRYAVIGHPVTHSRSPQIHDQFATALAQSMHYGRIDAPPGSFAGLVREFFANGGLGLNVTLPHKEAAAELVDELSDRARLAQAVNVLVKRQDGSLLGDNTDGAGLVADLARLKVQLAGHRVLIVGAGGAARGIIGPLLDLRPTLVMVVNRTPARAEALVTEFKSVLPVELGRRLIAGSGDGEFDLVINATSSGHAQTAAQWPSGVIGTGTFAYDLSYGAAAAPFLELARRQGAAGVADGLGMLIEQAAESFFLWRGLRPVTTALHETLQRSSSDPDVLNKP
jgi:shikimate dehydrogenase